MSPRLEIVATAGEPRLIERAKLKELRQLGPRQIAWLESRFPWISHNRVERLKGER